MGRKNKDTLKNIHQHVFVAEEKTPNDMFIDTDLNSTTTSNGTGVMNISNNAGTMIISNSGAWTTSPSTRYHTIQGSFYTPKSKEEAVKEILAQMELGSITRDDLVRTIELERSVVARNKISQAIENYAYSQHNPRLLECAEAALVEYDIQALLKDK